MGRTGSDADGPGGKRSRPPRLACCTPAHPGPSAGGGCSASSWRGPRISHWSLSRARESVHSLPGQAHAISPLSGAGSEEREPVETPYRAHYTENAGLRQRGSSRRASVGLMRPEEAPGVGPNEASSPLRAPSSSTGMHTGPAQGQDSCVRGPISMAGERNP